MSKYTKIRSTLFGLACTASLSAANLDTTEEVNMHSVRKVIDSMNTENISGVDNFNGMCTNGKLSGQIKTMYADYNHKQTGVPKSYATALGGELKYELATLNGLNAAVAFSTSQDIRVATGDMNRLEQNNELSSSSGSYTKVSQAYINYKYDGFNLRGGRQVIDTPLADSDDIRMVHNTFEAYIATYDIEGFEIMAGNLQKWQGYDAGLDNGWSNAGDKGTWLAGITYGSDSTDLSIWYYNIPKSVNAIYSDIDMHLKISKDIALHGSVQYLNETELDNSGVEASIYGAVLELSAYDLGISFAYNKSEKKTAKETFSGFGGGTLYTSMDTMILDAIAQDREVNALVSSISYAFNDLNFLYAYGNFQGGKDSSNNEAHIVEQDLGVEYTFNDESSISAYYIMEEDKQNSVKTADDWERTQISVNYSF